MRRAVDPAGAVLGEGPLWVAEENALYWVDIKGRRLHRYRLNDAEAASWPMPENLAWVIPRRNHPGFIAGTRKTIGILRVEGGGLVFEPKLEVEPERPGNRLNDAKADADGQIRFGTMDDAETAASGAFYTLAPDFTLTREDTGYVVANGPAMSPDGAIIYHTDSAARTIYRFPRLPGGLLGAREIFVRFSEEEGYPDGMTVDAQGGLWVAHWGGGRVTRFLPDATRDRVIALPVAQVTSCAFGGHRLDRLFVTTAAIGLSPEARAAQPLAGALFELDWGDLDPGIVGLPPHRFAG